MEHFFLYFRNSVYSFAGKGVHLWQSKEQEVFAELQKFEKQELKIHLRLLENGKYQKEKSTWVTKMLQFKLKSTCADAERNG